MSARRPLPFVLFPLAIAATTACVTNPTDDGTVGSRLGAMTLGGYAGAARAPLQLRAWNRERGAWDVVASFQAGTTPYSSSPPLYAWSRTAPMGNRYWVPAGSACTAAGSAWLEVRQLHEGSWIPLKTFNAAGIQCLGGELGAGATYAAAGAACATGEELVVNAPSSCVPVGGTSLFLDVALTASDDVTTWEQLASPEYGTVYPTVGGGRPLRLRADAFGNRALGRITLTTEVTAYCRPTGTTIDTAVTQVFSRTATATASGSTGAGTLGAAFDLDGTVIRPLCPAGTTLRRARVAPTVDARYLDGTRGTSGYGRPGGYIDMTF